MDNINYKYNKYKFKYLKLKFNKLILSGGSLQTSHNLYLFKVDWCGYCQQFFPIWERLKNNTKLIKQVNLITIDCNSTNNETKLLMDKYNVNSYPTIILQTMDGNYHIFDEPQRTEHNIIQFVNKTLMF